MKKNSKDKLKQQFFEEHKQHLESDKIKAIFTIRMKLMLISYLTQIPEYFGMPVWTPFLNFDIVKSTLNMSDKRRKNRIWQRDFFNNNNLNLEDMSFKSTKDNKLNYETAQHAKLEKIDIELMGEYVNEGRLNEINKILSSLTPFEKIKNQLLYVPKIGGVLRRLGFKNEYLKALYEYYVIKSIEKGLKNEF